jgi:hypothetical protein
MGIRNMETTGGSGKLPEVNGRGSLILASWPPLFFVSVAPKGLNHSLRRLELVVADVTPTARSEQVANPQDAT